MHQISKRILSIFCAAASVSAITVSAAAASDSGSGRASRYCNIHNTVHTGNRICNFEDLMGELMNRIDWDRLPHLKPGIPGQSCPELPNQPEQPDKPEAPDEPEAPDVPETPDRPEPPDEPEAPDVPETPEKPDIPAVPDAPVIPDLPETPEQPDEPSQPENGTLSGYASQVVALVNQERAKVGLKALQVSGSVQEAAQIRAKETERKFSHTRPNGSAFSTALTEAGATFRSAGENIAAGQRSPQEVMRGWMNSSGHKANILDSRYQSIGVGVYQGSDGTYYWTQIFTD